MSIFTSTLSSNFPLADLMVRCWSQSPLDRPDAQEALQCLVDMAENGTLDARAHACDVLDQERVGVGGTATTATSCSTVSM